jgi:hypothetical protein
VAFDLDEALLRTEARSYVPGQPGLWMFKIKGKDGSEKVNGLLRAEIAGLLLAVDEYRALHKLPSKTDRSS